MVSATSLELYPRERDSVPIVKKAGWVPEPIWTGAENLVSTGIRFPHRLDRSESLYRLSYSGPLHIFCDLTVFVIVCTRLNHLSLF